MHVQKREERRSKRRKTIAEEFILLIPKPETTRRISQRTYDWVLEIVKKKQTEKLRMFVSPLKASFPTYCCVKLLQSYIERRYYEIVESFPREKLVLELAKKITDVPCSFEKRGRIEKERKRNRCQAVEFFSGIFVVPVGIINNILSYVNVNKEILFSVGMVHSVFFVATLQNWREVRITNKNALSIPLHVWRGVRKVSFSPRYKYRSKKRWNTELSHFCSKLSRMKVFCVADITVKARFFSFVKDNDVVFNNLKKISLRNLIGLEKVICSSFPNLNYLDFFLLKETNDSYESCINIGNQVSKIKTSVELWSQSDFPLFYPQFKELQTLKIDQIIYNTGNLFANFSKLCESVQKKNIKTIQILLLPDIVRLSLQEFDQIQKLVLISYSVKSFVEFFGESPPDSKSPTFRSLYQKDTIRKLVVKLRGQKEYLENMLEKRTCELLPMILQSNYLRFVKVKVTGSFSNKVIQKDYSLVEDMERWMKCTPAKLSNEKINVRKAIGKYKSKREEIYRYWFDDQGKGQKPLISYRFRIDCHFCISLNVENVIL